MERRLELAELLAIYGAFLTDKQRECLSLSLWEDFSLTEIGERLGLSRQSAHDAIRRGEAALRRWEQCLCVAEHRRALAEIAANLSELLPYLADSSLRAKFSREIEKLRGLRCCNE